VHSSNIYAGGFTVEGSFEGYFTVISLTTSGTERWIYRGNWGTGGCLCRSIVYGADGYIYAAGEGTCDGYDADFVVVSLTDSGAERWHYYYDGPATYSQDHAYSVVYGNDGNIYASGRSEGIGTYYDIVILSLDTAPGIEEEFQHTVVKQDIMGAAILSGPLLLPKDRNCKVFDITGRVVLPDKIQPGIYFIEVDGEITQKVVKVR